MKKSEKQKLIGKIVTITKQIHGHRFGIGDEVKLLKYDSKDDDFFAKQVSESDKGENWFITDEEFEIKN